MKTKSDKNYLKERNLQVYYYVMNVYMMAKPKNNVNLEGLTCGQRREFPITFQKKMIFIIKIEATNIFHNT